QAQRIAIGHGAYIHAAATGELDEEPAGGVDFGDLEGPDACVELEFCAENASKPDCRENRAQCLRRRLDLREWHADHVRAVAEIWWVHPQPPAREQCAHLSVGARETIDQEVIRGGPRHVLL